MLPESVSEHYLAQQRLIVATLGLTRQEWASVSLSDVDATWAKAAPRVNLLTASAQLGAATNGAAYIGSTLDELGYTGRALGAVDPRAFAGFASDGRGLSSLLDGAAIRAKTAQSLDAGGKWLDMAVHTQIADAGRQAAAVGIAARPGVGWVRMVNPPCCAKCAVLAGKEFRYNQGFQRHPRCDCVHVPTIHGDIPSGLTREPTLDQIHGLSLGERQALENGGDLSRVVNARRGASGMHTTELAKRGTARLTPDGILSTAKSREEALDLLRRNGYITDTGTTVARTAARVEQAARSPKWQARWDDGRDVHISKPAGLEDAETKALRWQKDVDQRRAEIARLEKLIEDRKVELREVYGVPSRSVAKTIKQEGPYQQWTRELEMWRGNMAAYEQGLADALAELDRLRSLARSLPDFDPDNPLKFYGDRVKFYTQSDEAATYATDLELFPRGAHNALRDHFGEVDDSGFHLGYEGKLTDLDAFKANAGQSARGYRGGGTYDDVAGAYSPRERVCGCTNSHKHGSESMALHEGSHALDDALSKLFGTNASATSEFRAVWDGVLETNTVRPYYEAAGNPDGYLSEAFAESYASYLLKRATLAGDELAAEVVTSLGGGALGPKGLNAARMLIRWFEELERTMA